MSLLNKNRANKSWGEFLRYGVGEIMLVVIGILIAVSINNCNEDRKQLSELKNIYLTVKENLENDIVEIDSMLKRFDERTSTFQAVLNDSLSRSDYEDNWQLGFLIFGYPEFTIEERGYKQLLAFNSSLDADGKKLVSDIVAFYAERKTEIHADDVLREKDFKDNFYHWKQNHSWWEGYVTNRKLGAFIDYALNDQDYKNRVATYRFLNYDIYLPELRLFRERALEIIEAIDSQ